MPNHRAYVPKYCLHKPSGKAYCRIHGRVVYLGNHNSAESRAEYGRIIAEHAVDPTGARVSNSGHDDITVVEVAAAYMEHAEQYYGKNGKPTGHVYAIRAAMRVLRDLYGHVPAAEIGPLAIRAIQEKLIEQGLCRTSVNKYIDLVKLCFRWAAANEIVPASIHQALSTVSGLRRGRTEARESDPVLPVDDELVDATLPYLPAVVADMVRVHRLLGCRPGELCMMRPRDVDRSGDVWVYRPGSHKTEHLGRHRLIFIGPQAQAIIAPYLDREPGACCFSPIESEENRRVQAQAARKTPPKQGNRRGTNRRKKPKRVPSMSYGKDSYNRAIARGVEKANKARREEAADMGIELILLPDWHANQLRHSAATRIRRQFGLEAAQVILGHAKADVTQVYAERDSALAVEVARKIG